MIQLINSAISNTSRWDITPHGRILLTRIEDKIEDFRWIKDIKHLKRINKYRKRVKQRRLKFSDEDIMELILLTGEKK